MSTQPSELEPFHPVPENVVLAAVERAQRHDTRHGEPVVLTRIAQHLGFVPGAYTTRRTRPLLSALVRTGALNHSRKFSRDHWALTSVGRRQLTRARHLGEQVALPESPQHREWRRKHAQAISCVDEDRERVRDALAQAMELLEDDRADSQAWAAMADRLHVSAAQLSAAIYCKCEWAEPGDARRDTHPPIVFGVHRRVLGRGASA